MVGHDRSVIEGDRVWWLDGSGPRGWFWFKLTATAHKARGSLEQTDSDVEVDGKCAELYETMPCFR